MHWSDHLSLKQSDELAGLLWNRTIVPGWPDAEEVVRQLDERHKSGRLKQADWSRLKSFVCQAVKKAESVHA